MATAIRAGQFASSVLILFRNWILHLLHQLLLLQHHCMHLVHLIEAMQHLLVPGMVHPFLLSHANGVVACLNQLRLTTMCALPALFPDKNQ